jgi:hypothetical protein
MNPIRLHRFGRILVVALFALSFSICQAQDKSDPSRTITIDFPGGPLSKLVASLGEQGVKFSIIQSGNLDPVLPAFTVRDERFDSIIGALARIVEPQGFALMPVSPSLAVLREADWGPPSDFASIQIQRKLGSQSIEEFIGAIQAACEFANPNQKSSTLRFKYHPGTKLLFVAGAHPEIAVARQVIGSLPDISARIPSSTSENK